MPLKLLHRIIALTAAMGMVLFMVYGQGFRRLLGADSLGYYLYLPATFIYHNHKSLEVLPADKNIPQHVLADVAGLKNNKTALGYAQNSYTYGVALMEAPFFLAAHALESLQHKDANGFSDSYMDALNLCDLVYALLGLMLVYRVLRRYWGEAVSLLTVIVLAYGTNLFWFSLFQPGMSHVPLFFLYAALIWLTVRVEERPRLWLFILTGLVAGLITVIRPSDLLCLLIPLCYKVYNRQSWKEKVVFMRTNGTSIALAGLIFFIPIVPQLLYWKMMTGHYVYYSYGEQGFNWAHPMIAAGLFSAHNGWLVYTPIMAGALAGMTLYRGTRNWFLTLWTLVPLYIYVIYSWYCYTYINGFGSRPMINIYPLLAIPLAAFFHVVGKRSMLVKATATGIVLLFLAVNVSYSLQEGKDMLRSETSNGVYNMQILFKRQLQYNDLVTYDIAEVQPDSNTVRKIRTLGERHFEDPVSEHYVKGEQGASKYVYEMKEDEYIPDGIMVTYHKTDFGEARYIKCSGRFMYPLLHGGHVMVLDLKDNKWHGCTIENKIDLLDGSCPLWAINLTHFCMNKWGTVSYFVKLPANIKEGATINFFVWSPNKQDLFIDDLRMELYE